MELIESKKNKNIVFAKSLQDKKNRKLNNMCVIEGEKLIVEALKQNIKINKIFVLKGENFNFLNDINCEKYYINDVLLKHISTSVSPQPIVAIIDTNYQYKTLTERFLVLDNLQNPDNFGAIIRTAVATGFNTIYTVNCVDSFNEKVIRASMGTIFKTKIIDTNYQEIKSLANRLYVADMNGCDVFKIEKFDNDIGLVIGNEGNGVSLEMRNIVKNYVSIPMLNNVESLNASVSAGIIMYQIFTKLNIN